MNKSDYSDNNDRPVNPALTPRLTQWANEPSVGKLKEDLESARPAHDTHVTKVQRWDDLSKVKGTALPPKVKGRSRVQPKLIRRQAEWRYSALTEPFNSSEKLFDVKPVTFEDGDAARQNELVLNWQFRTKINRVKFIDDYVRACVDEGSAIVRVGWCRHTTMIEQEVPVWTYLTITDEESLNTFKQAVEAANQDPRTFDEQASPEIKAAVEFYRESGQASVAQQTGVTKEKVERIIENRPTVEVINPVNFYYDPTCGGDLDKAGFVAVSFETSKGDLLKDGDRYKNLDFVNWEGAAPVAETYHAPKSIDTNFNFKDETRKRVVAYEYWGLYDIQGDGNLVPIVATWIGDTLIRMEENPFPDKKPPFIVVNYMPLKRELMGESDAELLEDNQKILGAVTRGMIDLMGRSANSQQGFAKGMLDIVNRRRYESGQDYEYNPNMHPNNGIVEHKFPEIPRSAMEMVALQNQEAEALTGVKSFSGGMSGEAYGDVAAGIKGVLDAAAKREMAILRRLANGLAQVGRKICAMNGQFMSEQEVIRVTNEEFVTVNREDLEGDFDLIVDISTAEIDNNKAQDLAFMLQTMGPNAGWEFVQMILAEIARLKRMPELRNQILNYKPQPDPMAQQLQMLEIQKTQLEIQKLQSEVDLNHAKAMKEQTVAEQTVLDTVEQEHGVEHARNMQLAEAQAGANQDLEVTKGLLKPSKEGEKKPDVEAAVGWNEISKRTRQPV